MPQPAQKPCKADSSPWGQLLADNSIMASKAPATSGDLPHPHELREESCNWGCARCCHVHELCSFFSNLKPSIETTVFLHHFCLNLAVRDIYPLWHSPLPSRIDFFSFFYKTSASREGFCPWRRPASPRNLTVSIFFLCFFPLWFFCCIVHLYICSFNLPHHILCHPCFWH